MDRKADLNSIKLQIYDIFPLVALRTFFQMTTASI